MSGAVRLTLTVVAVVALGLAVAATRAAWQGRDALADGDALARRGDVAGAIARWRAAARWYVPVAGVTEDALDRLEKTATEAEAAGDPATAVAAWQAVRSAVLAIRGLTEPFADRRERADRNLARLMGARPGPAAIGATAEERTAWHQRVLAATPGPVRAWLALAGLGLLLWVGGAISLARRGVDRDGRLDRPRALRSAVFIAAGVAAWLTGLALA